MSGVKSLENGNGALVCFCAICVLRWESGCRLKVEMGRKSGEGGHGLDVREFSAR